MSTDAGEAGVPAPEVENDGGPITTYNDSPDSIIVWSQNVGQFGVVSRDNPLSGSHALAAS
jgi:hypothetical protein